MRLIDSLNKMSGGFKKTFFIRRCCRSFLLPAVFFICVFASLVATIPNYGLTLDEPIYIENAKAIEVWFSHALNDPSFFSKEAVDKHWNSGRPIKGQDGNVHPPFFKLSAIGFRHLLGTTLFDNIVHQYRVSTAFWTVILALSLFLVIRKFTLSNLWAILGGLSFVFVPRFFAHAHFFTTDMVIASLGFAGIAMFAFASQAWARILLGGVLFGASLATKFTGVLAVAIVVPLILVSADRTRFIREYCLMLIVAGTFFSLFNLPVVFNPYHELEYYFLSFFQRRAILSAYFGKLYGFEMPAHHPWVMLGITLPPLMIITGIIGLFYGIMQFARSGNRLAFFSIVPFFTLMMVYMLPSTPKHDGIRLFSSAWPFIVLISISGCYWLDRLIKSRVKIGLLICLISLVLAFNDIRTYHPYELSYYNTFIGGAKGAQDKGFIVTYWYEAFNKDFLERMSKFTGDQKAGIYSWPYQEIIKYNQMYGLYPSGLKSMSADEDYKYILALNRPLNKATYNLLLDSRPLIEIATRDGAYIGGLYQAKESPCEK
jgi:hypothetical protein